MLNNICVNEKACVIIRTSNRLPWEPSLANYEMINCALPSCRHFNSFLDKVYPMCVNVMYTGRVAPFYGTI